jgi:hypothetical protein
MTKHENIIAIDPETKTMPAKKDQPKESSHINSKHDIIAEIVHPEIDKKRKAAIEKSPKIRTEDLIEVPGMPRTWIQFKPGADPSSLENFQERVGKANSGGLKSNKKSTEPILEEI